MTRTDIERLRDLRDAIDAVDQHLGRTPSLPAGREDPLLHDALIGEAVKHLTHETRNRRAEVPWQDISGLRDLLAHEYFRIDITLVLRVVENDLPILERAVRALLAEAEGG